MLSCNILVGVIQFMWATAGEVRVGTLATFSCGPVQHGREGVGRLARNYLQQLCTETGSSLEDMPNAMEDRDEWQRRIRDIRARGTT